MTDSTILPDASVRRDLRRRLLAFFDDRARDLPWRRTDDPYAIWVSEIMLQQTRVETVIPYFERWLERFPDVDALAAAPEAAVLKAWEGLGYYSRARNLHRGAVVVRERFGGRLPDTAEALREVPGVGPYTSGAIASIAFGEPVPAVDGNVRRVFARLFDDPEPPPRRLEAWGRDLVDPDRPGDFNQALMELGATVCTPTSPACERCPVSSRCSAYAAGTVAERPAPKKRTKARDAAFVVRVDVDAEGRVRVVRRGPGLLQGMWSFPEMEVAGTVAERVTAEAGPDALGAVDHVFSHIRARYHVVRTGTGSAGAGAAALDAAAWSESASVEDRRVRGAELNDLALPVAQQRIAETWLRDADVRR